MSKDLGIEEDLDEFPQESDPLASKSRGEQDSDDPYLSLGFGICAYFNMLRTFMFAFFLLTIFALPIIFVYQSQGGLEGARNYDRSQFSLGNMGFSQASCHNWYIGIDAPITFSC